MKKLRIVINLEEDLADENAILKCIDSRKFSAARLNIVKTPIKSLTGPVKLPMIAVKLRGVEDLQISDDCVFMTPRFILLVSHLLPKVKVCKIDCAHFMNSISKSPSDDELSIAVRKFYSDKESLAPCHLLTDLEAKDCDVDFLSRILMKSKNLKRFSVEGDEFESEQFITNGTPIWQRVTFKLEKLELFGHKMRLGATFINFMARQKDLREMSLSAIEFDLMYLFELNRNIKSVNIGSSIETDMSSIPTHQLHKFKMLAKVGQDFPIHVHCKFAFNAPRDIKAFERSFLAFLDRDTNIPGLKNCQVITHLEIGGEYWIDAGVALSDGFISKIIGKTPKARWITIGSAKTIEEIKRAIDKSGHSFGRIDIIGTDGNKAFNSDGNEIEESESDSDEDD